MSRRFIFPQCFTEAEREPDQRLLSFLSLSLCSLSLREDLPLPSSLLLFLLSFDPLESLPPPALPPLLWRLLSSPFFLSLPLSDGLLLRLPLSRLRLRLLLLDDEDEEDEDDDEERLDPEEEEELPLEEEPEEEDEELLLRLRPFLDSFSFFLPFLPFSSSLAGGTTAASWESGSFSEASSPDFSSTIWFSTVES